MCPKQVDRRMGEVNHALQVDVDQPRMIFDRNIPEEAKGAHPDIVDPDIDITKMFDRNLAEASDVVRIADVRSYSESFLTAVLSETRSSSN